MMMITSMMTFCKRLPFIGIDLGTMLSADFAAAAVLIRFIIIIIIMSIIIDDDDHHHHHRTPHHHRLVVIIINIIIMLSPDFLIRLIGFITFNKITFPKNLDFCWWTISSTIVSHTHPSLVRNNGPFIFLTSKLSDVKTKREFHIVMSGQFRTLAMFLSPMVFLTSSDFQLWGGSWCGHSTAASCHDGRSSW